MGNDLIKTLAEAVKRGVAVTIITSAPGEAAPLTLKWVYKDHSYAPSATFCGAGYRLWAMDCDGDFAEWKVRRGPGKSQKNIIAEGTVGYSDTEYDLLEGAMLAAETALREEVRKRIAALRAAEQVKG